jgi:hypothetical protein
VGRRSRRAAACWLYFGHGFYWWQDNEWFIGDAWGIQQYLNEPGWKVVRFGRTVTKEQWVNTLDFIKQTFGSKASYWPREPRR